MVIRGLMASKSSLSLNRAASLGSRERYPGLASSVPPALIAKLPQRFTTALEVRSVPPAPADAPASDEVQTLTARELDVLQGVAAGHSNKVIARHLDLTPETVKWHLKNIMRKLDVRSRHDAARRASEHGILPTGAANSPGDD